MRSTSSALLARMNGEAGSVRTERARRVARKAVVKTGGPSPVLVALRIGPSVWLLLTPSQRRTCNEWPPRSAIPLKQRPLESCGRGVHLSKVFVLFLLQHYCHFLRDRSGLEFDSPTVVMGWRWARIHLEYLMRGLIGE